MRTIKFRARAFEKEWGTNIEKGDWVYGNYFEESIDIEDNITFQTQYFIKSPYGDHYQDIRIDIKTLGQFTGLLDKKGKEVFENDIIEFDKYEWYRATLSLTDIELQPPYYELIKFDYDYLSMRKNDFKAFCVVVGNLYENPELLER